MTNINFLWNSNNEKDWIIALEKYWFYIKPTHLSLEKEFDTLDPKIIERMNAIEWYEFLLNKYFYWKYTAPNRYATTTSHLKKYKSSQYGLDELYRIKQQIFAFNKNNSKLGLELACSIKGLGTAGASGLLAILFPIYFGTVDQFAVNALKSIENFPEHIRLTKMNPEGLTINDALVLNNIMKSKALEINTKFSTSFWNPRKIDKILWVINR